VHSWIERAKGRKLSLTISSFSNAKKGRRAMNSSYNAHLSDYRMDGNLVAVSKLVNELAQYGRQIDTLCLQVCSECLSIETLGPFCSALRGLSKLELYTEKADILPMIPPGFLTTPLKILNFACEFYNLPSSITYDMPWGQLTHLSAKFEKREDFVDIIYICNALEELNVQCQVEGWEEWLQDWTEESVQIHYPYNTLSRLTTFSVNCPHNVCDPETDSHDPVTDILRMTKALNLQKLGVSSTFHGLALALPANRLFLDRSGSSIVDLSIVDKGAHKYSGTLSILEALPYLPNL
jgi:hypothetical protein